MASWSVNLVEHTRAAICDYAFVPFKEFLHFKNLDNRFGVIAVSDILAGRLLMIDRETNQQTLYADATGLIDDGWALD